MVKDSKNPKTMEELLASLSKSPISLERGQEVKGKIISISSDVTVDLGLKSEGVIPLREIPDKDVLKVGDTIKATVSQIENENGQVILTVQKSPRQKTNLSNIDSEKWNQQTEKLVIDDIYKGKVTKVTQFGVFVQLQDPSTHSINSGQASSGQGVEGLIHISKLGPEDKFETGQDIRVSLDSLDKEKKRISLSPVRTSTKGLIYK